MDSIIKYTKEGVVSNIMQYSLSLSDLNEEKTLDLPSIKKMQQEFSKTEVAKCIIAITKNGIDRFKVSNTMDEEDLVTFAVDFMDKYYSDCVEDLALCLKYARQHRFGKDFNRIDSSTLFDWFGQYAMLKAEKREQRMHNMKFEKQEYAPNVAKKLTEISKSFLNKEPEEIKPIYSHEKWWDATKKLMHLMNVSHIEKIKKQLEMKNITGTFQNEIDYLNEYLKKD